MADAFHLQIVSPSQIVMDGYVPMVEVPGTEGDFGVLPGHAPFFSMIRPGVITVHMSDGLVRKFFAASGYADVSPQSCTILSDHIQDVGEITVVDAQEALEAARSAMGAATSDSEKLAAQKLIETAEALQIAAAA